MFVTERFVASPVKAHGKRPISNDGNTWYPQACWFLKPNYHIHSPLEKSLERTMQYIKEGTEGFDDYFPCRKAGCRLPPCQKLAQPVCKNAQQEDDESIKLLGPIIINNIR